MKPDPGRGAREHHDDHAPGQQALVQALLAWQSQPVLRRSGGVAAPAVVTGVQLLAPAALHWQQPLTGDALADPLVLGSCDPWAAAAEDSEWLDLALSLHHAGRWWRLPTRWWDDDVGADRAQLLLHESALPVLAAAVLAPALLRSAAADSVRACWACREDGLGQFMVLLLDLGWPG